MLTSQQPDALRQYIVPMLPKNKCSFISKHGQNFNGKITESARINDSLRLVVKNQEERVAHLEAKNEISLDEAADVILEQNNPNPFAESTVITYYIPDRVQGNAELIISPTSQSPILQRYSLTKGLPTQMSVSAQDLYTGVFVYSIIVNGKVLSSKKFIVIK